MAYTCRRPRCVPLPSAKNWNPRPHRLTYTAKLKTGLRQKGCLSNLQLSCFEKYNRILPIKSLREVENPWKGISLNRCILVAIAIVVLSSGAEIVQETLEPFFEEAEESDVQDEFEASWWDSLAFWNWGDDDESDQFSKNRAAVQPGERPVPKGSRKREIPERLLKERN